VIGDSTSWLWWPRRAEVYGWGFFVPPSVARLGTWDHPSGVVSIPR